MDFDQCACSGKTLARLLRPAVMAILNRGATHGYALLQELAELDLFAGSPPDASGVYKLLKTLEEEGIVTASWDLEGPAKRMFALTGDGRLCLQRWAQTLSRYREQIDSLLTILPDSRRHCGGAVFVRVLESAMSSPTCACGSPSRRSGEEHP